MLIDSRYGAVSNKRFNCCMDILRTHNITHSLSITNYYTYVCDSNPNDEFHSAFRFKGLKILGDFVVIVCQWNTDLSAEKYHLILL